MERKEKKNMGISTEPEANVVKENPLPMRLLYQSDWCPCKNIKGKSENMTTLITRKAEIAGQFD